MPQGGAAAVGEFRVGDIIQYSSDSRAQWLHAQVEHVHADKTLTLSVTTPSGVVERRADITQVRPRDQGPDSPLRKEVGRDTLTRTTTPTGTQYKVGQAIEYSSVSRGKWVPATVEAINRHGELTIRYPSGDRQLVGTHRIRHRPAAALLQDAARERRRAEEARREAERLREEMRRDAAKLEQLDQLARNASLKAKGVAGVEHLGGGAAAPAPAGGGRPLVVRKGDRISYSGGPGTWPGRSYRAVVDYIHQNTDVSIEVEHRGVVRLTIAQYRKFCRPR